GVIIKWSGSVRILICRDKIAPPTSPDQGVIVYSGNGTADEKPFNILAKALVIEDNYYYEDNTVMPGETYYYGIFTYDEIVDSYSNPENFGIMVPPAAASINDNLGNANPLSNSARLLTSLPNPFTTYTNISYTLSAPARINLSVFDVNGRMIRSLVNSKQAQGMHQVQWSGRDSKGINVPSGNYLYQIRIGNNQTVTKRLIMVK
ncbi:MAG: FlgD immunoglobulin-like domain containing protein, partial [bacterium]